MSGHPLVHFFLAGAVLFAVDAWLRPPDAVVVTAERRASLTAGVDDPAEVDAAVQRWIDEELLVREAKRLGLDRGDPVVRRRLVQKLRFLQERVDPPSTAALEAWLAEHPERFRVPARWALEVQAERALPHGRVDGALTAISWRSRYGIDVEHLAAGDQSVQDTVYGSVTISVTDHTAARLPALDEIHAFVEADYLDAHRERASQEALAELRASTEIR